MFNFGYMISFGTHAALICWIMLSIFISGCLTKEEEVVEPMAFTVVIEEVAADIEATMPDPEPVEPEPIPEPEPLPPPPIPEPDPVIPEPVKEEPKPKPPKPKAPKPKAPRPRPTIKVNTTLTTRGPITDPKKRNPIKAPTTRAPSASEIRRLLEQGAVAGSTTQIPSSEQARCLGLLERAFRAAYKQHNVRSFNGASKPSLTIKIGRNGVIRSISLARSSGDRNFDKQVLAAARSVGTVRGLTAAYIDQYPEVTLVVDVE